MREYTVAALIEAVHEQFAHAGLSYGHGTDNAWDEAVALVLGVTGAPDDQASLTLPVDAPQSERVLALATQRVSSRQPLAYLLGFCQYMDLTFAIEPGVVVPRSPIGYLLQSGLEPWLPAAVAKVLDLCTGTGCLGILAAHLYPAASVTLVELDPAAAAVARKNVALHDLASRVEVVVGDVTSALELSGPYDLIVSNPPYVDARGMDVLPDEYRAEPSMGLAAGREGLDVIDGIFTRLPDWLAADGLFVGEVGASAPALLARYPHLPLIWPDLPHGGEGVFALEGAALASHTARGL